MMINSLFNAPVSIYAGVRDVRGVQTTVGEFMRRRAYDYLDGDEKRALPCITVGGQFHRRKLGELIAPSGVVQLDFDAKDNVGADWQMMKLALSQVDGLEVYTAISASGNGVFALFHVPLLLETYEQRGEPAYLQAHRNYTQTVARHFYDELGYVADGSCINRPNGLRFISADDAPIHANAPEVELVEQQFGAEVVAA